MNSDLAQRIAHLRESGNFSHRQDGKIAVLETNQSNPALGDHCKTRENINESELDKILSNTDYNLRV